MSDGICRRTPLHCQAKGDTGLTSVCRPDVVSLSFFFWSNCRKKIAI